MVFKSTAVSNPIPLIPFPFDKGKGKVFRKRVFAPLRHLVMGKER
jgi:hypothetical protein